MVGHDLANRLVIVRPNPARLGRVRVVDRERQLRWATGICPHRFPEFQVLAGDDI